jgi:RNA polymerase sigma-70 factor (ECF subfamily)
MTERNSATHHASPRFSEEDARGENALDHDVRPAEVADLAEARLHARAAQGEVEAIESVWRRNRRWIAAVLAAHAPRGVEIEDLLQEVAATFLAKAREIRDAASVRGWLRVVAVNEARMAARDRGIERKSLARFAASWRGESADRHAAAEARETLELLARLPAQYAEPLLLQAGQGLSQREIAEILDVPETTIETRLARARRMLRQLVAEDELRRDEIRAAENYEATKQRTKSEVHGSMMR